MMKNCLFSVALMSLALAVGCAKGGNGVVNPPMVAVAITSPANVNAGAIYTTQALTLTATVTNSTNTTVSWSLTGAGTLAVVTPPTSPATAIYTAPAAPGSATVTAALVSDPSVTGPLPLTTVDITTDVSPSTLSVGYGLTQQFTAVAVPDDTPQNMFTWMCMVNGNGSCNFVPTGSGLATYTAPASCTGSCNVQISALSMLDQNGCVTNPKFCTTAKFSLVPSRVNGAYAFRFSGYDNSGKATAAVGTFNASTAGGMTTLAGMEDVLTSSGWVQQAITGSYVPISPSDPNSNNAGVLTLTPPAPAMSRQYQVALDGAGDIEMIESDGLGTGSGIAQPSANPNLFAGPQTFAFGFTGVDSNSNRVGYAGVFPMDGNGNIAGGSIDVNDNGQSSNSVCGAPPCTVTGTYGLNMTTGVWQLTLTSPVAMTFDFYIASGSANKANPLTFYAISTDPGTNPAVSGTMVLQDSTQTYNIAAFKGNSVSALSGTNTTCAAPPCANVSLTLGVTDGNGGFSGQFDQNNAGTILTGIQFPTMAQTPSPYTYTASSRTNGRYVFQMLGNPNATPIIAPMPFVLYASGQNRGFLLDQSSSSVMTGTMNPQGKGSGDFGNSTVPGTYAAATTSSANSAVSTMAANLLLAIQTDPMTGALSYNVSGTQYQYPGAPGPSSAAGTYSVSNDLGTGTIALTQPSTQNYAIYVVDTTACTGSGPSCIVDDFLMIDEDKTNANPSIIFAKQ